MSAVFKPGDKVRVIDNNERPDLVIGSLRTVVAVSDACVQLDDAPEAYTWTTRSRLELVLPAVKAEVSIKSGTQLAKVRDLTLGQGSWTLSAIASATGASEAAVSARLRDLRAMGYTVTCSKPKGEAQRRYEVRTAAIALPA